MAFGSVSRICSGVLISYCFSFSFLLCVFFSRLVCRTRKNVWDAGYGDLGRIWHIRDSYGRKFGERVWCLDFDIPGIWLGITLGLVYLGFGYIPYVMISRYYSLREGALVSKINILSR